MWQPINTDTTMTNAAIVVRRREKIEMKMRKTRRKPICATRVGR